MCPSCSGSLVTVSGRENALCFPGPSAALLPSRQGLTAVPIKALLCFGGAQLLLGHVLMQPEVAKCQLSPFTLLTEDLMSYRSGRELCRCFFFFFTIGKDVYAPTS